MKIRESVQAYARLYGACCLLVTGTIKYKGAKIQLLDLPGIIEGAKDGKGRGRQACYSLCSYEIPPSVHCSGGVWAGLPLLMMNQEMFAID